MRVSVRAATLTLLALTATAPVPAADAHEGAGLQDARSLLLEMRKAMLGTRRVKEFHSTAKAFLNTNRGRFEAQVKEWMTADGRLRQELQLPHASLLTVWDGSRGALGQPPDTHEMSEGVQTEVKRTLERQPVLLASVFDDRDWKITAAGSEKVGERPCRVVEIATPNGEFRIFIDEETHLPRKESYVGIAGVSGPQPTIDVLFEDWREVSGVKVPFKEKTFANGKPTQELVRQAVEIDAGFATSLFEPPTPPSPAD
ncbi:MAG: hypothetical protein D6718_13745 [Acidobacteria bacterium]|nr:MAG: hypothetical protein D6718_13745 [Acidobacteriota bacterium]